LIDQLKSLFLSEQNVFRLEVTPVSGLSSEALATVLAAQGFHVAHPSLVAAEQDKLQTQSTYVIGALIVVASFLAILLATLSFSSILACLFSVAVFAGFIMAGVFKFQIELNPETMVYFVACAAFMASSLVIASGLALGHYFSIYDVEFA
jgi:hypothetical protein